MKTKMIISTLSEKEQRNAMMQEMSLQEMKDVNGGMPWWSLYELLCNYLIDNHESIAGAYAQVKAEGGTVCTDMPFK